MSTWHLRDQTPLTKQIHAAYREPFSPDNTIEHPEYRTAPSKGPDQTVPTT